MITEIICQCIFECVDFNPNDIQVPKSLNVIRLQKIGDLIDFGRDKGRESTTGRIIFDGSIEQVVLYAKHLLFKYNHLDYNINVCILVSYINECNFEFSHEQTSLLSELLIPIGITCYFTEGETPDQLTSKILT